MELTPKRKPKPATKAPAKWRLKQPVSKADNDAVFTFTRAVKARERAMKELIAADQGIEKAFEELKRRNQIEYLTESVSTADESAKE